MPAALYFTTSGAQADSSSKTNTNIAILRTILTQYSVRSTWPIISFNFQFLPIPPSLHHDRIGSECQECRPGKPGETLYALDFELAFLFAFKSGLFNIGAEGQFLVGALGAAIVGISFERLPAVVHVPLALLVGAVAGGLWGFIPAFLKTRFGAHEVITTMMLSYVALYLTGYMVNYPFKAPGWVAQTVPISPSAALPRILPPTQLSASIFLAGLLTLGTQYVLRKTAFGFEIRATGLNPDAAQNAGINVDRKLILALVVSGAIAGLGGSGEILGVHRRFIEGFSPGYGWDGLAVALVGGNNPYGALLAAVLFGALRSGGMIMTRATGVPLDIVFLLRALVILFVAAPTLIRSLLRRGGLRW